MNINATIFLFCFLNELDCLIKTAFNIFSHMIFQMVRQILDSLIQMIISRVISSTINNMCDSILLQLLKVSGDIVRAQIQKIIEDWRANFVEKGVLILLSWGTLIVELFVQKLLWIFVWLRSLFSSSLDWDWLVYEAGCADSQRNLALWFWERR